MEQKDLKPREAMIQRLQKKYPHLNVRLGTADDPECKTLLVSFFPTRTPSTPVIPGNGHEPLTDSPAEAIDERFQHSAGEKVESEK